MKRSGLFCHHAGRVRCAQDARISGLAESEKLSIPTLASIYVLSYPVAKTHARKPRSRLRGDRQASRTIAAEFESRDKGRNRLRRRPGSTRCTPLPKGWVQGKRYQRVRACRLKSVEYIISKGNELAGSWMDLLPEFDLPQ
jgi:hypothetical protein